MRGQSAARASRAIGSMFFSVFGGAWVALWCLDTFGVRVPILLAATAVTATLFLLALLQFQRNKAAHAAEADSPQSKLAGRVFNIVNAVQWSLIFVVAFTLSKLGHQAWIIPSIIFIVGAHFIPLAIAFKVPRHHVTGALLMLLAILYPLLSGSGPSSAAGCFGAGLILWVSAAVALMRNPPLSSDGA